MEVSGMASGAVKFVLDAVTPTCVVSFIALNVVYDSSVEETFR